MERSERLILHRIAQRTDAFDRRLGDVAGLQRHPARHILDHGRDRLDHLAGVRLLHHLAVQTHLDVEVHRIGNFVGRDQPRTGGPGLLEVLAGDNLAAVPLVLAQAGLVDARVAE